MSPHPKGPAPATPSRRSRGSSPTPSCCRTGTATTRPRSLLSACRLPAHAVHRYRVRLDTERYVRRRDPRLEVRPVYPQGYVGGVLAQLVVRLRAHHRQPAGVSVRPGTIVSTFDVDTDRPPSGFTVTIHRSPTGALPATLKLFSSTYPPRSSGSYRCLS